MDTLYSLLSLVLAQTPPRRFKKILPLTNKCFLPSASNSTLSPFLTPTQISKVKNISKMMIEDEISLAQKHRVEIISYFDKSYPSSLKHLPDPPPIIYVSGKALSSKQKLSIVGARKITPYGASVVKKFLKELAPMDIETVSGVAIGVDTEVHKHSLKNRIPTVGVLGTGLLRPYPHSNISLIKDITINGTIISEFPLNTPPSPLNFPRRNRIIAALGFGTLVVEAREKSGSLITANYAMELGKEVFAVHGSIFNLNTQGTHRLISDGAKPICYSYELLPESLTNDAGQRRL